ncbi:hypothetical protein H0E84_00495 [Luteimonas sp. SJ-92]|uniref:YCII-related domain-containing protein n=1 Tax=Luteimonas salinisoli TaxID=2752307 RepID=A0A853J725_9GAMM|nr:hypothetical protein [Luteimonas salinisoli]NZA24853.1 hypothetical protein [Luteimonas salinisoli]
MFIVLLKFSTHKARTSQFLQGHNAWLGRGFDDGVFLLAGSLQPGTGGAILAHDTTLSDLRKRVDEDPFVVEDVVRAEIFELSVSKADERLAFLG